MTFTDQQTGIEIKSERFEGDWNWWSDNPASESNPKLRFKVLSLDGMPSPFVVGVAVNTFASDGDWKVVAIGVVKGQLERLNYETLETGYDGGVFFGDLGQGMGLGAAEWAFVWGEDEVHPPPHKYEVKLYKWNGRRFEWYKVLRTHLQHDSSESALRALGFRFKDLRETMPGFW